MMWSEGFPCVFPALVLPKKEEKKHTQLALEAGMTYFAQTSRFPKISNGFGEDKCKVVRQTCQNIEFFFHGKSKGDLRMGS